MKMIGWWKQFLFNLKKWVIFTIFDENFFFLRRLVQIFFFRFSQFVINHIKKWKLAGFFIWIKIFKGKTILDHIFWIFQNFIILLKIHLKNWNFAHILWCPKTTFTPKIRRFRWKFSEIFHFLCFLSFGYHTHKNWRKISNKKRNLCTCVSLIYILT